MAGQFDLETLLVRVQPVGDSALAPNASLLDPLAPRAHELLLHASPSDPARLVTQAETQVEAPLGRHEHDLPRLGYVWIDESFRSDRVHARYWSQIAPSIYREVVLQKPRAPHVQPESDPEHCLAVIPDRLLRRTGLHTPWKADFDLSAADGLDDYRLRLAGQSRVAFAHAVERLSARIEGQTPQPSVAKTTLRPTGRFFVLEGTAAVLRSGFLVDPGERYSAFARLPQVPRSAIEQTACLLIVCEGGLGKTTLANCCRHPPLGQRIPRMGTPRLPTTFAAVSSVCLLVAACVADSPEGQDAAGAPADVAARSDGRPSDTGSPGDAGPPGDVPAASPCGVCPETAPFCVLEFFGAYQCSPCAEDTDCPTERPFCLPSTYHRYCSDCRDDADCTAGLQCLGPEGGCIDDCEQFCKDPPPPPDPCRLEGRLNGECALECEGRKVGRAVRLPGLPVATRQSGDALALVRSVPGDSSVRFVFQVLASDGTPLGDEVPLGGAPRDGAEIAVTAEGYAVVWGDVRFDTIGGVRNTETYLRRFDRNGAPLADETRVTDAPGWSTPGGLLATADGFLLLLNERPGGDVPGEYVMARPLDATGASTAIGTTLTDAAGSAYGRGVLDCPRGPDGRCSAGGPLALVHVGDGSSRWSARAAPLGDDGALRTPVRSLSGRGSDVRAPVGLAAADGFRVGWSIWGEREGTGPEGFVAHLDARGAWVGDVVSMGPLFESSNDSPRLLPADDGGMLAFWGVERRVYVRRLGPEGAPPAPLRDAWLSLVGLRDAFRFGDQVVLLLGLGDETVLQPVDLSCLDL